MLGKVYIRKGINGEFDSPNTYAAYYGFRELGREIKYFTNQDEIIGNNPEDIVIGHIVDVRRRLKHLGKDYPELDYPELDYPESLRKYLGRELWQSTLGKIINNPETWEVFIKPLVGGKLFTGVVIREITDIRSCSGVDPKTPVWCSEVVKFVSEWRCFVRYGKLVGVKHYNGDPLIVPSREVIEKAIADYKEAPNAYVIDFGVTEKGENLLIEVNDAYAVGCYGLDPVTYAKFISARWSELTNTEDRHNF